ncbi:hypothetical protein GCM10009756_00090 [Pseudokineococcus marinus]
MSARAAAEVVARAARAARVVELRIREGPLVEGRPGGPSGGGGLPADVPDGREGRCQDPWATVNQG